MATLYKLSSNGKILVWSVNIENSTIQIFTGYHNQELKMTSSKSITNGKNIGKKNETTPEQQASMEMQSKIKKKKQEGFVENIDMVQNVSYLPMLAHNYTQRGHDIVNSCCVQPKIDGIRCCAFKDPDNKIRLLSRTGHDFSGFVTIRESLLRYFFEMRDDVKFFDGELYFVGNFENLTSVVRTDGNSEDKEKIIFHIFDYYSETKKNVKFIDRIKKLKELPEARNIQIVNTSTIEKNQIEQTLDMLISFGYEGLIIRNPDSKYELGKRSKHLQKYKKFNDSEYKVIGFTQGVGNEAGLVIWKCVTQNGREFNVRPAGTHEERERTFPNAHQYIGKMLTVKYQELSEYGVPRFPVGLRFRHE